jgi:mono/diheme cytochrome c family protein
MMRGSPFPPFPSRQLSVLLVPALLALGLGLSLAAVLQARSAVERRAAIGHGRYDFATGSCISCHALYPISSAGGAIDLTHEGRRRSLAWLEHEIRFPTSIRPPTPPGQADDLALFLSSLK